MLYGLWPVGVDPSYRPDLNPNQNYAIVIATLLQPGLVVYVGAEIPREDIRNYVYDPVKIENFVRQKGSPPEKRRYGPRPRAIPPNLVPELIADSSVCPTEIPSEAYLAGGGLLGGGLLWWLLKGLSLGCGPLAPACAVAL
jgi:hypothetical protein